VNGTIVLEPQNGTRPDDSICAEGRELKVLIHTSGVGSDQGRLNLTSTATGSQRDLELTLVPTEERTESLKKAALLVLNGLNDSAVRNDETWKGDLAEAIQFDLPKSGQQLGSAVANDESLNLLADEITEAIRVVADNELFIGTLNRMVDPIEYQCYLGDAWTDTAAIAMIPLPVIEPELVAIAPEYARAAQDKVTSASSRHLSVLEGSEVQVAVRCTNGKSLESAWLTFQKEDGQQRINLEPTDEKKTSWKLVSTKTPLYRVSGETRFELHVTDEDGLQPDAPIRGLVRLRADRLPNGSMTVVHRVVLPAAKPKIDFRMTDDYGISKAMLHISPRKRQNDDLTVSAETEPTPEPTPELTSDPASDPTSDPTAEPPADDRTPSIPLLADNTIVLAKDLPYTASYEVDLAGFDLVKGDQIELTLELIDYRGEQLGESFFSDPLLLEISDESGVLAAISEADERSEQRITDIIKRQLGIGDSP
jgi:hypothetical protein